MPEEIKYQKGLEEKAIAQPLVKHIYTADPSVHVFNGKIYIYPSHDIDAGEAFDDLGSHFDMHDYHVLSMDSIDSEVIDNGVALHVDDVPWADTQTHEADPTRKGTHWADPQTASPRSLTRHRDSTTATDAGALLRRPLGCRRARYLSPERRESTPLRLRSNWLAWANS